MAAQIEKFPSDRKRLALVVAAVLIVLEAAFFAAWIWREESVIGVTIVVRTIPVDPRDLLRGQYFQLSYEFDRPDRFRSKGISEAKLLPGETVYAALAADGTGRYSPLRYDNSLTRLRQSLPSHKRDDDHGEGAEPRVVIMQGTVKAGSGSKTFDFGLNRFFVPEGTPEPEETQTVEVKLRVAKNLTPRIQALLLDGQPWPNR